MDDFARDVIKQIENAPSAEEALRILNGYRAAVLASLPGSGQSLRDAQHEATAEVQAVFERRYMHSG